MRKVKFGYTWLLITLGPILLQENIKPEEFEKLLASIKPTNEQEIWLQIPWQPDLLKAREMAAKEGKPIFLWAMNGNPLGCV